VITTEPLSLTRSELLRYRPWPHVNIDGVCHLRVYEGGGWLPLVIVGELDDNAGRSVTNGVECVAATVDALLGRRLSAGEYVLVEYHPEARFDRVSLNGAAIRWAAMSREDVETLLGGPVEVWRRGTYLQARFA
jgi:hypothetical protein